MNTGSILGFFRDASGRVLIILGVLSIMMGVLFTTQVGSLDAALGLFVGVLLLVLGFVVHFELFRVKLWSKKGISLILMCMSPLLLILAIISVLFASPDFAHAFILSPFRMGFVKDAEVEVLIPLMRLYTWLTFPLAIAGVCLFVFGILLRIYDEIR